MQLLKKVKIVLVERRFDDAWYDLGLRMLRRGEVSFYRVKDFLTGEWLFKVCMDREFEKVLVKAVKCPPGPRYAQLEGNTMVFQRSLFDGMFYDAISLTELGEGDKLVRRAALSFEEVPPIIRENYLVRSYEEAVGKRAPGKGLVTLCRLDYKAMIALFILEKAWTIAADKPEEKLREVEKLEAERLKAVPREIDTGHVWECPICRRQNLLLHIEKGEAVKHVVRELT